MKDVSLTFCIEHAYPTIESHITVVEWSGQFFLPNEHRFRSPLDKLQPVARTSFYFNYQAAYEWCWHLKSSTEFYTAPELADKLLKTLLNLQDRFERGEIKVESDNDLSQYPSVFKASQLCAILGKPFL